LQHKNIQGVEGDRKTLWKWRGLHRIQTFIWQVAHERILTNCPRSKWGVGISPWKRCGNNSPCVVWLCSCYSCMTLSCSFQLDYWILFVWLQQWIFNNINKHESRDIDSSWQITFMIFCWFLWTWNNRAIFKDEFQRPIVIRFWQFIVFLGR
jgi:hypothetical protein